MCGCGCGCGAGGWEFNNVLYAKLGGKRVVSFLADGIWRMVA